MSNLPEDARATIAREILAEHADTNHMGMTRGDLLFAAGRLEAGLDMALQALNELSGGPDQADQGEDRGEDQ